MDIYLVCMDLNLRHMDMYWIRIGYQWISFLDIYGYHLDMVWICLGYILRLRPCPVPARRPASARQRAAARGWAGQGGASGQASQPVTVHVHQAIVTGLDTMPQCQADSSITPVPGGPALGI